MKKDKSEKIKNFFCHIYVSQIISDDDDEDGCVGGDGGLVMVVVIITSFATPLK